MDQLLAEVHEGSHQYSFLDIEIRNEEMKGPRVAKKRFGIRDPYALIVFVGDSLRSLCPCPFALQVSALDYIDRALSARGFESRIRDSPPSMPIVKIVEPTRKIALL